jgi:hypothetical protein
MAVIDPGFDESGFEAWLQTRPAVIQEMARTVRPNRLYRIESGHRAYVYSYCENGTLTMVVDGRFNRVLFGRRVFGIPASEPVECDLPTADELVGDVSAEAGYTDDDVRDILIPMLREEQRKQH